ncbi:hypothetical protein HKCCSP123_06090 [Rhodobacterales bacterium HKCCSP123]|nr:hypothetical protein [Rhodobacterales bacterium HKCCSP123]
MSQGSATHVAFNTTAQTTLRILIASYFLAVALQIIPGTDLGALFSPILPAPFDGATAAAIVFILSFMVMTGVSTRAAALIIALMTFYASYLAMVELGVEEELGSFWRDLALIAALLLTYSEPKVGTRRRRRLFSRSISPRRINAAARVIITPRAPRPAPAMNLAALKAYARPVADAEPDTTATRREPAPQRDHDEATDNIFAEDYAWN